MNEFLKLRGQIEAATQTLKGNGFVTHPISCKDWELEKITKALTNGDLLDMGANGSFVLHNAIRKGVNGRKVGIDLVEVRGDNRAEGAEYIIGDLMDTGLPDESFDMIVSQSVIEHEVDLASFASETSRLLRPDGKLIVSFDYCTPKVNTDNITLYNLKWNILDLDDVAELVQLCHLKKLHLTDQIDWNMGDLVINPKYCSPGPVSYTFGILEFEKK